MVFQIQLFVAGDSPRSRNAILGTEDLCAQLPSGLWQLSIVDVLRDCDHAENEGVLATPTLLCRGPFTCFRIVGEFRPKDVLYRFLPASEQIM